MPKEFEGVIFTKERMTAMVTTMNDRFTQGTVESVDDPRQHNRLLAVNYNLQAVESLQGNGNSSWSSA